MIRDYVSKVFVSIWNWLVNVEFIVHVLLEMVTFSLTFINFMWSFLNENGLNS